MITCEDIEKAQKAWADAVVAVGALMDDRPSCEKSAAEAVERLYAFSDGEVLFKPTRAVAAPFRNTRQGALSYFIGGDADFPEDTGFAMNPWISVRFENHVHHLQGNRACAMGHYYFRGPDGSELKVEYTFGYMETPEGSVKICLHHSSMPYSS